MLELLERGERALEVALERVHARAVDLGALGHGVGQLGLRLGGRRLAAQRGELGPQLLHARPGLLGDAAHGGELVAEPGGGGVGGLARGSEVVAEPGGGGVAAARAGELVAQLGGGGLGGLARGGERHARQPAAEASAARPRARR